MSADDLQPMPNYLEDHFTVIFRDTYFYRRHGAQYVYLPTRPLILHLRNYGICSETKMINFQRIEI